MDGFTGKIAIQGAAILRASGNTNALGTTAGGIGFGRDAVQVITRGSSQSGTFIRQLIEMDYEDYPGINPGDVFENNDPHYGGIHSVDFDGANALSGSSGRFAPKYFENSSRNVLTELIDGYNPVSSGFMPGQYWALRMPNLILRSSGVALQGEAANHRRVGRFKEPGW